MWAVWSDKAVWKTAREAGMDVRVELEMPSSSSPIEQCANAIIVQAIEAFIDSWNQDAAPFEWTKREVPSARYETFLH